MTAALPAPTRSRVILAGLALAAGIAYALGIPNDLIHGYYGPAVYSMSTDWSAFLWGTQDTAQSITMDKLPLAFQVQALSVRIFGWSNWAILMPQVLAAVATAALMYAAVRRWAGERAGLVAAAAYGAMPIVAALSHSQIVDTLLTFFLVAAAWAWMRAVEGGRVGWLLLSGVFVGLAFNVKMVQAWAVLPALGLAYLLFAPGGWGSRLGRLVAAGVTTAAVSLWWVGLAWIVSASSRPWIDGSASNSAWDMVFGYNFLDRYTSGADSGGPGAGVASGAEGGVTYLLTSSIATQIGWLYPLVAVGLVLALWPGRSVGESARRVLRAGAVMWALWLATLGAAFSLGRVAHSFYVVALAPPIAAFAGVALV